MPIDEKFEFPRCMHVLAASMHMNGIDPSYVTITMPADKWWDLRCLIERHIPGFMHITHREDLVAEFRYMGFRFVPERKSQTEAA
jgi:hypothetical protein